MKKKVYWSTEIEQPNKFTKEDVQKIFKECDEILDKQGIRKSKQRDEMMKQLLAERGLDLYSVKMLREDQL